MPLHGRVEKDRYPDPLPQPGPSPSPEPSPPDPSPGSDRAGQLWQVILQATQLAVQALPAIISVMNSRSAQTGSTMNYPAMPKIDSNLHLPGHVSLVSPLHMLYKHLIGAVNLFGQIC